MDQGNLPLCLLIAAALVLLMTPGLAFFYGGMVKAKSVISMMMMSFGAMASSACCGCSTATPSCSAAARCPALLGDPTRSASACEPARRIGRGRRVPAARLRGLPGDLRDHHRRADLRAPSPTGPSSAPGWSSPGVWATVVYFPVASWVFNLGSTAVRLGGLRRLRCGVIDFAGGTAVHINAGAAALALALVLGKRVGFQKGTHEPHNVPLMLLGAGAAVVRLVRLQRRLRGRGGRHRRAGLDQHARRAGRGASSAGWSWRRSSDGKPTSIGAASGAVAGLVAITPACNILTPGLGDRARRARRRGLRPRDRAEVQARLRRLARRGGHPPRRRPDRHPVRRASSESASASCYTGSFAQLLRAGHRGRSSVLVYSFALAYAIGFAIEKTIGFRIKNEDEVAGVDPLVHGEEGYVLAG